jgi:hypothetical protein
LLLKGPASSLLLLLSIHDLLRHPIQDLPPNVLPALQRPGRKKVQGRRPQRHAAAGILT